MAKKRNDDVMLRKGKRVGRRELRDNLILNIRKDIPWIGDKRETDLINYINNCYMNLTYDKR